MDFICSFLVDIIIMIWNFLLLYSFILLQFKLKYCSLNSVIFSYFYKNCFKLWHFH